MRTLADLLPEIARLGSREAVRWSNGYRTWVATYEQLYRTIGAIAIHLTEKNIRKSDRVLIWGENRLEWIATFWACIACGIEAVPVDYRFSEDLVRRIQRESRPKLIVDNSQFDQFAQLPGVTDFTPVELSPDDIVEIVYTSGTTGEPKGIVHRHRNICANLRPFRREIGKYKNWARPFQPIRILDLLPLSHMFGQSMGLFMPLFLEGSVAFTTEIHSGKIMEWARENRISVIVSVPRILENLKNEVQRRFPAAARPFDLSRVSWIRRWWRFRKVHAQFGWKFWAFVAGGARLETEIEEFWARLGFVVIQGYGLTEASPVVAVNHPFSVQRGSLGKVVEGQDVMIAPDGEILVRGESVTTTEGGWLHTGDLGEIDSQGRLYYRGRKKDLIITPEGLNIHPEDVEAVLNQFPEIRESAVVGVTENGSERVHAALIMRDRSADLGALVQKANQRLEAHQRIRTWSLWPDDDFPRTPSTLKIKRHEVAKHLNTKTERPQQVTADLGAMSSLERVELLSGLEQRYQVELDEEAFSKLTSSSELEAWLRQPEAASKLSSGHESRPSEWARSAPVHWFRTVFQQAIAIPLFRRFLPLTVAGLENLKTLEPPVIFAANHTSHLDAPAIFTALPYPWRRRLAPAMMQDHFLPYFQPDRFSRKEVMFAGMSYFLACAIYNTYPLPQRMSGARRALNYTGELVSRGYCPLVFPEGLRTADGRMQPFRPGIGMMAIRLRVPIVPLRVFGLYEIYSVHDYWPRRGPVHVSIGAPLKFSIDTSYEEAARQLEETIRRM